MWPFNILSIDTPYFSLTLNFSQLKRLTSFQCYRCEGMEKADQFYHKGKLFPLFSDQPDIQAAWKAWDEIVGFGEKLLNAEQIRSSKNSPAELVNKCLASKHSDHTIVDAETKEGTFLANGLEGIADVHR